MIREMRGRFETEIQGTKKCEDGGRDWGKTPTRQGTPRTADSLQKLGERHGMGFPSELPEGTYQADTLILDFWSPEL